MNRQCRLSELPQHPLAAYFQACGASFVAQAMTFAFLWLYAASAKIALRPLCFLPFP
jgi:hypothetical protein